MTVSGDDSNSSGLQKHGVVSLSSSERRRNRYTSQGLLMIVCIIVGYIGGSINGIGIRKEKEITSSGTVNVAIKTSNHSHHYNYNHPTPTADDNNEWQLKARIEELKNELQMTQKSSTKSKTSVIEEVIPTKLLPRYTSNTCDPFIDDEHCKTLFPVSRNMLRQSRPIVGNTERLHIYLSKLRNGVCTTALFMGGSVTEGHNGGGTENAYPKHITDILNARYSCQGGGGTHEYRKTPASVSMSNGHFSHWSTITSLGNIDIVFLETNVNDGFINNIPHALEDKGQYTRDYASGWYFETIVRRLLLLRQPNPIAIVTLNADWSNDGPNPNKLHQYKLRTKLFQNQEPIKNWISSMYEVPVFSVVNWLFPMTGKMGTDRQYDKSWPWSTINWHSDSCCHPQRGGGHHVLALVIAYCLMEEEKVMLSYNKKIDFNEEGEHDYTMDGVPLLRDPLYLSPDEDELYVWNNSSTFLLDFTDPNGEEKWKKSIAAITNFTWYADNKDMDKYGLIADGVSGGQHIAISLTGAEHGLVELSYVKSYENFGIALAWLNEAADKYVQPNGMCNITAVSSDRSTQRLDGMWAYDMDRGEPKTGNITNRIRSFTTVRVSLPATDILNERLENEIRKYLHICLTPKEKNDKDKRPGLGNKFKLLSVRVS